MYVYINVSAACDSLQCSCNEISSTFTLIVIYVEKQDQFRRSTKHIHEKTQKKLKNLRAITR